MSNTSTQQLGIQLNRDKWNCPPTRNQSTSRPHHLQRTIRLRPQTNLKQAMITKPSSFRAPSETQPNDGSSRTTKEPTQKELSTQIRKGFENRPGRSGSHPHTIRFHKPQIANPKWLAPNFCATAPPGTVAPSVKLHAHSLTNHRTDPYRFWEETHVLPRSRTLWVAGDCKIGREEPWTD